MIDRLERLIAEAAEMAARHDGTPVAARHVHAGAYALAQMLVHARDRLIRRAAASAPAEAPSAPENPPGAPETRESASGPESEAEPATAPPAPPAPAEEPVNG